MAYIDFKDLPRRAARDKLLGDKAFYVAKNTKYEEYQRGLASMVYIFLYKESSSGTGFKFKKEKYIHRLNMIFGVLILQICN